MKTARKLVVVVLSAVCLYCVTNAAVRVATYLSETRRGHTPYEELAKGMTGQQVVAILGRPAVATETDRGAIWWYGAPHAIQLFFAEGALQSAGGTKGAIDLRME